MWVYTVNATFTDMTLCNTKCSDGLFCMCYAGTATHTRGRQAVQTVIHLMGAVVWTELKLRDRQTYRRRYEVREPSHAFYTVAPLTCRETVPTMWLLSLLVLKEWCTEWERSLSIAEVEKGECWCISWQNSTISNEEHNNLDNNKSV